MKKIHINLPKVQHMEEASCVSFPGKSHFQEIGFLGLESQVTVLLFCLITPNN